MRWKTCCIMVTAGLYAGFRGIRRLEEEIGRNMVVPLLPKAGQNGERRGGEEHQKAHPLS